MKLHNYELDILAGVLYEVELKGVESRMRTRFIKILAHQVTDTIEKEKVEMIREYAQKNEDGSIKTVEGKPDDVYIDSNKTAEFNREMKSLMSEEFHIEETENNKTMLLSVAETVLSGEFTVKNDTATMYDKWCEEFEGVVERYTQKEQ